MRDRGLAGWPDSHHVVCIDAAESGHHIVARPRGVTERTSDASSRSRDTGNEIAPRSHVVKYPGDGRCQLVEARINIAKPIGAEILVHQQNDSGKHPRRTRTASVNSTPSVLNCDIPV